MAKSKSMGSVSWFKHRTAYLNKVYGTSLSPTRLAAIYKKTGTLPPSLVGILDLKDTRNYVKNPASIKPEVKFQYYAQSVQSNQTAFARLAERSRPVASILNAAEGYINKAHTTVYKMIGGEWYYRDLKSTGWKFRGSPPPQTAEKLTSSMVRILIADIAKKIKGTDKDHPGIGYDAMPD